MPLRPLPRRTHSHTNPVSYYPNVPIHTAAPDILMHDLSHSNLPDSLASFNYPRYLQPPTTRRAYTEDLSLSHPSLSRNTRPITIPPARFTSHNAASNIRPRSVRPPHAQPSGLHPKSGGISWHRRGGETAQTSSTTSGVATPNTNLQDITTPISSGLLYPKKYKGNRLRATSLIHDAFPGYPKPPRVLTTEPKKKPTSRRRRSSLLTAAFGRRRSTVINWVPDQLLETPTNYLVHPLILLPRFPTHWSSDTITLYTNSIRTELNDLIFLATCLQHATPEVRPRRRAYSNTQADFYRWFQWFSLFSQNTLRAMQQHLFPFITQMLFQRDVMISRCTAVVEAQGESHISRWEVTNASLCRQIQQVCDYIHTVESRLKRLERRPALVEYDSRVDLCNSNFVTISHLVAATVNLLDNLDSHISATLALRFTNKKTLQSMYCQFAITIIRDPEASLGWSAVLALTRWMENRKVRQAHVTLLARAARLRFLSRYRANTVHRNIVKAHRAMYGDDF